MDGSTYSHRPADRGWHDTEDRERIRDHEALDAAREPGWSEADIRRTGLVRRERLEKPDLFVGLFLRGE